ncbi:hypothetical protein A0M43_04810 [Campylobacter jejuni]|uniref:hypothetical protein n=1 Tax=Campylobacter TaxID=194 RepID=UPI0001C26BB7|nr:MULTISPECIES: hypothetical protein [Campylobacter]EDO8476246.1 hypothetical protein [Campylobacter jejuni]EFC31445.1 hypothetical protein C1336_000060023 [Campylobacter jejuni subsp. jejuni 1336]OEW45640.1 hypothetical protein AJ888_06530 [Campylobacter sp. BCW_6467]OEX02391.1 hypothetical protein A0M43_04810 [Campylobacter jejuni]OEX15695.1 hypothetical protein A0M52_05840 [Campylobacter jejuni]
MQNNIILYAMQDKKLKVELYEFGDSVYLNQESLVKLFYALRENITMHINNILQNRQLQEISVCKKFLHTTNDNK